MYKGLQLMTAGCPQFMTPGIHQKRLEKDEFELFKFSHPQRS